MVVDGGNSPVDRLPRPGRPLAERGIGFVDAGVSGGVWGLDDGYALMVGGADDDVGRVWPVLETWPRPIPTAPAQGLAHVGPGGRRPLHQDGPQRHRVRRDAGLRRGLRAPGPPPGSTSTSRPRCARGRRARSSGRGCSTCSSAVSRPTRASMTSTTWPPTPGRGAGRWRPRSTAGVPVPAIAAALFARFDSQHEQSLAMKAVAALREQFGGHAVVDTPDADPA